MVWSSVFAAVANAALGVVNAEIASTAAEINAMKRGHHSLMGRSCRVALLAWFWLGAVFFGAMALLAP